jgi:transposase
MPKTHELSDFERGEIIGLWKANFSTREIEKILDHPQKTISNIIMKYRDEGMTTTAQRSGRPKILLDLDKRHLVNIVKKNRNVTIEELTDEFKQSLSISISSSTVRNYLHQEGYFGRVAKKKPYVSESNRKKRLGWCRMRKDWNEEWNKIIFSDESRFELFNNDSHNWVWRKVDEKYKKECLKPTVKKSIGIMVWGCFHKDGIGPLVIVEGNINGVKYRELLEEHLLPFYNALNHEDYLFQDDNAPCHTARIVKEWKEENFINILPWPAQSPDLNPIENLWSELERNVRSHKPRPKNKNELIQVVRQEWNNINNNILVKLIESMPRRVKAVIKNNGNPTKY